MVPAIILAIVGLGAGYGGYKQSGIGREESIEELLSFTQSKNINITL